MSAPRIRSAILTAIFSAANLLAQEPAETPLAPPQPQATAISQSQLVAGIRDYPASAVRALLTLSQQPLVLRQLADDPALIENPEKINPPVSAELRSAIKELSGAPAILEVAAAFPLELKALRELYREAPEGVEQRILQLRAGYEQAALAGVASWQKMLERDPVALGEYRALLTRFCEELIREHADFPHVRVTQRQYLYACVPNEAILEFAGRNNADSAATKAIETWWSEHGPAAARARRSRQHRGGGTGGEAGGHVDRGERQGRRVAGTGARDHAAARRPACGSPLRLCRRRTRPLVAPTHRPGAGCRRRARRRTRARAGRRGRGLAGARRRTGRTLRRRPDSRALRALRL